MVQLAGGERDEFSERSQLGLLDDSSLQALKIVKALPRMLKELQKFSVQQVLLEKNKKARTATPVIVTTKRMWRR